VYESVYTHHIALVHKSEPTPNKALGQRVKQLRAEQELTQEELADRCGMFRTYMSRIESGAANPTLTMLYSLAAALNVPVQALFDPAPDVSVRVQSKSPPSRGRVSR
jgi:transcriptional regulator with XRE-family HTH domain